MTDNGAKIKFLLSSIFLLVSSFLSLPKPVLADDPNFSLAYDLSYKVQESGNTTVTQNIHLTNLTTEKYAQEYVMKLASAHIFNLHAYDRTGALPITTNTDPSGTQVHIKFRDQVAGLDQTLHWTLVFDTPDIAKKIGRVWEISIPPYEPKTNPTNYTIGLYPPKGFGQPIYQKPEPTGGANIWTKKDIPPSGISVAYLPGEDPFKYQNYHFKLSYHLKNPDPFLATFEIALPPDTNYQKVFLDKLSPQPLDVRVDKDGNWLAKYSLAAGKDVDITAEGSAAVTNTPSFQTVTTPPTKDLLKASAVWPTQDPEIKKISLRTGTAEKIYNFVVRYLSYDHSRIGKSQNRLGALGALKFPQNAICMEFTDLFVTIARAAGIPAREVDGFGMSLNFQKQPLSQQRDILHSWPQYFDPQSQTWIMIDPTWANTTGGADYFQTLDFDHFAFAIRGENDTYPFPAGSYKSDKSRKDVQISPSDAPLDLDAQPKVSLHLQMPKEISAPFASQIPLEIDNSGPVSLPNLEITVIGDKIKPAKSTFKITSLPPFARRKLYVTFPSPAWNQNDNAIITLKTATGEQKYQLKISPLYFSPAVQLLGALIILAILSSTSKTAGNLLFPRRRG